MRVNQRNVAYFASCNSHVDKAGLLQKFSQSKNSYQTKWFVLKGNILFYFDKKVDRDPQGAIVLEGCRIELADTAEGFHAFQLSFSGETSKDYRFVAESAESMEAWMKALSCATYDYIRAVVDELQRQMDEISHHEGGDYLKNGEAPEEDGEGTKGPAGEPVEAGAVGGVKRHSGAIVRATFPSDKGSTLKTAAFPNPLYDVLDEVPNSSTIKVSPSSQETARVSKTLPVFIVNRDSSESSEEEDAGCEAENGDDTTSSDSQYANLDPSYRPEGVTSEFDNAIYATTSLEDVSLGSANSSSFKRLGLSNNLTHSDTDLTEASHYTQTETLPISKSAMELPNRARGARKKVPPQKPPRFPSALYENVAGFASGLSEIPRRGSVKLFHRNNKSSESLAAKEKSRSVFHTRDVRSFPEMHQEFGVLVIQKVNEFRLKRGHSH